MNQDEIADRIEEINSLIDDLMGERDMLEQDLTDLVETSKA
jgi:hypothetical protein